MADPTNPIRYSDLIQPDDSIQQLIDQLEALIAKYGELRSAVQSEAAGLAKSMQNVSGATEEQRDTIMQTAKEADVLAERMKQLRVEEGAAQKEVNTLKDAQREYNQIVKLQAELARSAEGSYKQLSAQYRLNKIELNNMSKAMREGTPEGRKLEAQTKAIYEEMSRLQKATGKYTLEVGHYENALKALPGPMGQVIGGIQRMRTEMTNIGQSSLPAFQKGASGALTMVTGAIGIIGIMSRTLTSSRSIVREFEQATTNLQTILGVTDEQMRGLSETARALGRDTQWTASQVVSLQTELAKLGFTIPEIKNMQGAVLDFATATGANLAEAAAVAGASLRAFGLDSSQMEDTLNVMVAATNRSALSFDRIKQSVGTVFPIAKAFGVSLRDTTALLGALANAGFDASSAATATRNILLNLANANGKLAQRMGGAVNTFDGMISGLRQLQSEGLELAEALELTDKRSVSAFSAFLDGVESVNALRDSLEDVDGVLHDIAEKRMATTEGAIKQLNSAWDNLVLSFDKGNTVMGSLVLFATDFIKAITPKTEYDKASKYVDDLFTKYGDDIEGVRDALDVNFKWASAQLAALEAQEPKVTFWDKLFGVDPKVERQRLISQVTETMQATVDAANHAFQERKSIYTWTFGDGLPGWSVIQPEPGTSGGTTGGGSGGTTGGGGKTKKGKTPAWSVQSDKTYIQERLKLLQQLESGEIASREIFNRKISELEITTLESRLTKVKKGSSEYIKIESDLIEKRVALQEKNTADLKKTNEAEVKAGLDRLNRQKETLQLEIAGAEKGSETYLMLRLELIEKEREIELKMNRQKTEDIRQDEALINAKYDRMRIDEAEKTAKKTKEKVKKATKTGRKEYENIFQVFGLTIGSKDEDEAILKDREQMVIQAVGNIKDSVSSLIDSWRQAAQAAIDAADAQVESAEKVVESEREAAANGYANSLQRAERELALAKKQREEATKEAERAQQAQLAIDSATQASSLVTASANIWKSLSGIPIVGPALAGVALAGMWASFLASRIRARQVTKESYGEGTVELLEGGSHASGHDIPLGYTKDGKERRAEGGEFFAVINKRNSRKYRDIIPDVINAFNDGSFAERYQRAGTQLKGLAVQMMVNPDLGKLEAGVDAIRKQGEESRMTEGAYTVIRYKNLTRRVKN